HFLPQTVCFPIKRLVGDDVNCDGCVVRVTANPAGELAGARLAIDLVRPEGVEPPAYRFEACRSIQLSYGRIPRPTRRYYRIADSAGDRMFTSSRRSTSRCVGALFGDPGI